MPISYRPGHVLHPIQARLIAESPWGWRDAVVRSSTDDGRVTVDYVLEDGRVDLWSSRCPALESGTPVRVHERLRALDVAGEWFSVRIDGGGLGPVPPPAAPGAWASDRTVAVVDLGRGTGVGRRPWIEPSPD